ncbi:ATP-dependent Clp protease ATP-binding subunit [Alkalihalobacillus trypoxylicola]|uniref:ATP-dependent Clp protease ATP-binding subunit n=1 Tax=Alkalihalobacillus trypoxylicola TaxID=519424 RepID=A0A161QFF5_9BACI|nr:ATP-dependent Clp protease ATP-binding subunit [Alkalihalobacillus trypoxylicola]KYG27589.1 ATP-dependent Clp protease ATP-binding subunit [Alkalihalobacillus trypoxylicola]
MLCQKCQQNEAMIHIKLQYNQTSQDLKLCSSCYQEIQKSNKIPSGFHDQFPFTMGEFESFNSHANEPSFFNKQSASTQQGRKQGNGFLDQFGHNLTNAAKAGLIDPVIGRDEEIKRVIEILNRRNKNNPVLIGEPGVGKTAIAEGLALRIVEGNAPAKLLNKEVISLDVASLVSNTGIRGQFEERMKQLISELQQRKNVILFIDELHLIVGAGSAEGSMDAGNILKPALARGELQLVGATTLKEYREIEKDAALERRFQPVTVNEPSIDESLQILKGIKKKYEEFHSVSYSEEALRACVTLSQRYIQDRFLPDKAIDLMDEAGSKLNLQLGALDEEDLTKKLQDIQIAKDAATKKEQYEKAAKLRDQEKALENQLKNQNNTVEKLQVTIEHIEEIIEKKTGIPVGKIQENESTKINSLQKHLMDKVIGQNEAVEKVAKAIRRSRAGLKAKYRPIGSFLFVGPTGVGKTELSKRLAEELFGSKESMIRLDMSEYMEKHSVSKLIGSPPGYVGHEEAGQLTEKVRRNPYSIILLDEIEKAHPDVMHMFLQILEDGQLTDSQGRKVSFKDSVIIMTSNAGVAVKKIEVGFENQSAVREASILDSLSDFFKPEFLNRFDNIIEFKHLEKNDLIQIVDIMLSDLKEMVAEKDIELQVTASAKEALAELGYHKAFGARPLRRTIQEQLEDKITDIVLDDEQATVITVDAPDQSIVVSSNSENHSSISN